MARVNRWLSALENNSVEIGSAEVEIFSKGKGLIKSVEQYAHTITMNVLNLK